jgi:hypothetical protein
VLVALLAGLAVLAMVLWMMHPAGHWPRLLTGFVCLAVGLGVGLVLARSRRWRSGLVCAAVGVAAASVGWVFVPTTHGLSLWTAHGEADRLAAELAALPPTDFHAYDREVEARTRLVQTFPSFQAQIKDAESGWGKRSLDSCAAALAKIPHDDIDGYRRNQAMRAQLARQFPGHAADLARRQRAWMQRAEAAWVAKLEQLPLGDYAGLKQMGTVYRKLLAPRGPIQKAEWAWLERGFAAVKPRDYAEARRAAQAVRDHFGPLRQAEAEFVQRLLAAWSVRTARAEVAEAEGLSKTAPEKATRHLQQAAWDLREFGPSPDADRAILLARRKVVAGRLDTARRQVRELIACDAFREVAELARRFVAEVGQEAATVDESPSVLKFHEQCQLFAVLARSVGRGVTTPLLALRYPGSHWPADLAVTAWLQTGRVFPSDLSRPMPRR